jgi:hypothetical protein
MQDTDRDFVRRVSAGLEAGLTYQQIADREGMTLPTLYGRIRALGYRTQKRLVPIHAPDIDRPGAAA